MVTTIMLDIDEGASIIDNKLNVLKGEVNNKIKDLAKIKILVHEIKGLFGLYSMKNEFDSFATIEKLVYKGNYIGAFKLIKSFSRKKGASGTKCSIECKDTYFYKLIFHYTTMEKFEYFLQCVENIATVLSSKRKNGNIIVFIASNYPISQVKLLCKSICKVKYKHLLFIPRNNYLSRVVYNDEYINNSFLDIFLYECCNNISNIAGKKYNFDFKSNKFLIKRKFIYDYSIVFLEIVKNAFAHSGRINNYLRFSIKLKNNELIVKTFNRGKKISRKSAKKLFDQYYSTSDLTKISGNGIGLYDVKQILERNGGSINYKNKLTGVCFTLRFPIDKYL